MMQMLADAGTPLDIYTNEGITPLMMAVEEPNIELTKFLLDKCKSSFRFLNLMLFWVTGIDHDAAC
jgi:ankyrin repeat protein